MICRRQLLARRRDNDAAEGAATWSARQEQCKLCHKLMGATGPRSDTRSLRTTANLATSIKICCTRTPRSNPNQSQGMPCARAELLELSANVAEGHQSTWQTFHRRTAPILESRGSSKPRRHPSSSKNSEVVNFGRRGQRVPCVALSNAYSPVAGTPRLGVSAPRLGYLHRRRQVV